MAAISQIVLAAILFQIFFTSIAVSNDQKIYFYMDQKKDQSEIIPLVFLKACADGLTGSIIWIRVGFFRGMSFYACGRLMVEVAQKYNFHSMGDTVPILDQVSEDPFSQEYMQGWGLATAI